MIELIAPWEDHVEEVNERKRLKYHKLVSALWWAARYIPVEVGARGFPAQSVHHLLSVLCVKGKERQ